MAGLLAYAGQARASGKGGKRRGGALGARKWPRRRPARTDLGQRGRGHSSGRGAASKPPFRLGPGRAVGAFYFGIDGFGAGFDSYGLAQSWIMYPRIFLPSDFRVTAPRVYQVFSARLYANWS